MTRKSRRMRRISTAVSFTISFLFFVAGSRLLYADYRKTTTVTTTVTPSVPVNPPVAIEPTGAEPREVVPTDQPAVLVPATVSRQQVRDNVTYDIDMKKMFLSNENVRGFVIVNNSGRVNLADSFTIRLYHNGKLVKELLTRIAAIAPGETRYSFKEFGIPQINSSAADQGDWTISIYDMDPAYSKDVDFRILSSLNSSNLQR